MPQIIAAMDEDSKITRLMACRIIDVLLKVCGRQFEEDKFTNTYTGKCESLIFFNFLVFNQDLSVEELRLLCS